MIQIHMISLGTNFFLMSFFLLRLSGKQRQRLIDSEPQSCSVEDFDVDSEIRGMSQLKVILKEVPGINYQIWGDVTSQNNSPAIMFWSFSAHVAAFLGGCQNPSQYDWTVLLQNLWNINISVWWRRISQSRSPSQRGSGLKGKQLPSGMWVIFISSLWSFWFHMSKGFKRYANAFLSNVELGGGLWNSNHMSGLRFSDGKHDSFCWPQGELLFPHQTNQNLKEMGET